MANNFATATSCVAWYKLEDGALTTDSTLNGNTLTNIGVASDTTNFQEGAASGMFDVGDYLTRTNANLSSNFPMKAGTSNTSLTICGWFRLTEDRLDGHYPLWSIYLNDGWTTLSGITLEVVAKSSLTGWIGHGEAFETGTILSKSFVLNTWYHVGATWDNAAKRFTVRVWDGSSATTGYRDFTNSVDNSGQAPFYLSRWIYSGSSDYYFGGQQDEVVVFNEALTEADIDDIRGGTFTGEPDYEDMAATCDLTFGATAALDYSGGSDLAVECAITIGMSSSLGNSAPILIHDVSDKHVVTYLVAAGNNSFWYSTG